MYGTCRPIFITTSLRPYDNIRFDRLEKIMSEPVEIPNWLLVIYEGTRRFNQRSVGQMIRSFVEACVAVGKALQTSSTGRNILRI